MEVGGGFFWDGGAKITLKYLGQLMEKLNWNIQNRKTSSQKLISVLVSQGSSSTLSCVEIHQLRE